MKISAISTKNFIGARDVDIKLQRQITIICGHNYSGKSSLSEAVRMALTGETVRVSLKKGFGSLITEGQQVGYAVVDYVGGRSAITLPNGAHEHTGGPIPALLPYVIDAQRFASMPADDRRLFLFGLMGLRTDGDSVTNRLIQKGCDIGNVDQIAHQLRVSFDAAHKEARAKSRDAKSAWRAITGETYGGVKAATWSARKPAVDTDKLARLRHDLADVERQVECGTHALGEMQGQSRSQAEQSAKLAGLRQKASLFARADAKLRKDQSELAEWQAKCESESRKGGKQLPTEPTYACPSCGVVLRHDHANGALIEFTPPPVVEYSDPGKLVEYQRARDMLARAVENDKRDLADADLAARTLAGIEDAQSAPAPSPEEIGAAKANVEALKKIRSKLLEAIKTIEQDERAASLADERTDDARGHHYDVAQWEAIADALSPSGIPGEMLAEALAPINERLANSSTVTEWLRVNIDSDMIITGAGRPYSLLSESERWRADAMIAEAISHISGVRLLVLDRVDVLDMAGRDDLLYWLDELALSDHIETALLFATLKELPANLPYTVRAVWIANGEARNVMAAS